MLLCPEFLVIYALERVELMGAKQNTLSKVYKGSHSGDLEEPVAKVTQELQCSTTKTVHLSEWLNIDSLLCVMRWFLKKKLFSMHLLI